jgi:site-specific DNA recombinase
MVERHCWEVAQVYSDSATSGASILRPGYQKLLLAAPGHAFEVVVAEGLDRLSRDLADVATLYKQLSYWGHWTGHGG